MLGVGAPRRVSGHRDQKLAAICELQRGRVTRGQLREAGIGDDAIDRLIARGQLLREYAGVYVLAGVSDVPLGAETAALLAYGDGALLCHASGGKLWEIWPAGAGRAGPAGAGPGAAIDILVAGRQATRRHDVRLHRTRHLLPRDVRIHRGLPVTSPARTLLDLADLGNLRALERAFEEAFVQRLVRVSQLDDVLARACGRRGASLLAALVQAGHEPAFTRQEAERRFLELMREADLPQPVANAHIHGFEVDFYWPQYGLVVEIDSVRFHSTRAAFERDRAKGAKLTALGLVVMRFTWRQIADHGLETVARTAQAIAALRAAGPSASAAARPISTSSRGGLAAAAQSPGR